MLKNLLLTSYRSLLRNKTYALINISGFAICIASCLVLFYVIHWELSFDTFHSKKDRIYRITNEAHYPDGIDYGQGIPAPFPEAARTDFSQVEQVATIFSIPNSQINVLEGPQNYERQFIEELGVFFAEPQFFKIFDFEWLYGSPDALTDPNTVALTRATAEKYFGDWQSAVGKFIEYHNSNTLKITGILENTPSNTDFPLKVVISFKTRGQETQTWGSITSRRQCYFLLDEHSAADQIQGLMPAFEKKHHPADDGILDHYTLQPLRDLHFDGRYGNFNSRTVSRTMLLSLGLIGLLLIIVASINFVNLAIAQAMKRSKEVGVRKVLGSSRWHLSLQFFAETFLILVVASLVAIVLTQVTFPEVGSLLNLPASFDAPRPLPTILLLGGILILVTAFSGVYPARVMGAFTPAEALKSKISTHTVGGVSLRKGLIVVQFAIAQVLVIATLVVINQTRFFHNASLGFDKDSIVLFSIPTDSAAQSRLESFRTRLLLEPAIQEVSFGFSEPLSGSNRRTSFQFDNASDDAPFEVNIKYADVEYFETYDLSLVAGRFYQSSDTAREYVVNETFLKRFGISNAEEGLGKTITRNGVPLPIVGVLKDFHLLSLQEKIEPLAMICNRLEYRKAGVKLSSGNLKITGKIEDIYRSFFPDHVFEYRFLDDNVDRQYADEDRLSSITRIFACIAILISSLGLYGLVSFMTVQRTKEVGIRKALGATAQDIVVLFSKEFIALVLIAFVVAAPLTGYFMTHWLNAFAYKVTLSPWIFIVAATLSGTVAIITISFQSVKAALANPVDSLRSE